MDTTFTHVGTDTLQHTRAALWRVVTAANPDIDGPIALARHSIGALQVDSLGRPKAARREVAEVEERAATDARRLVFCDDSTLWLAAWSEAASEWGYRKLRVTPEVIQAARAYATAVQMWNQCPACGSHDLRRQTGPCVGDNAWQANDLHTWPPLTTP